MTEAMKPCPFCGAEGELSEFRDIFRASCALGCMEMESIFPTETAAITDWNTRATDDAHEALVEALKLARGYVLGRDRSGLQIAKTHLAQIDAALAKGRAK